MTRPIAGELRRHSPRNLHWRASDVLDWISEGKLKLHIHKVYPLAEAAQAQRDLESRKTTGKLLLVSADRAVDPFRGTEDRRVAGVRRFPMSAT